MVQFLLRKLLHVIIVMVGVALIAFLLMHAIPGNPWSNYSNSPRVMLQGLSIDRGLSQELERRYGFDLPLWRQFIRYIIGDINPDGSFYCGAVCGNLGPSIQHGGRSVQDVVFSPSPGKTFWESRFGYSIQLVLLGALFAAGLGIPLGILSAIKSKSALSRAISVSLAALISIPNFVLGLLALLVLGSRLQLISILPDWNIPGHWIVPAIVLAVMPMASIARVTRASLMNILNEDFIRTARAKGLTGARVMLTHALRVALAPVITFLGPTLFEMFTGLFIVENMFSFPGIGREYWDAALNLDYPMIFGLTILYATGIVLVNLLMEVLSALLDPRVRLIQQQGGQG